MEGYFDRIEEGKYAVIIAETEKKEFIEPLDKLPQGSQPGDWFILTIEEDQLTAIQKNDTKTASSAQKTEDLMAKLRTKNKGSKFKKK